MHILTTHSDIHMYSFTSKTKIVDNSVRDKHFHTFTHIHTLTTHVIATFTHPYHSHTHPYLSHPHSYHTKPHLPHTNTLSTHK